MNFYTQECYPIFSVLMCHHLAIKTELNPRDAKAYNHRGVAYFYIKEYDSAWSDVNKAQALGGRIHPKFLQDLQKASGRER
jgi:hypothetical protein